MNKPKTKLRFDSKIFGRLIEDHDLHRSILQQIDQTKGNTPERRRLFKQLNDELKGHAAAEEQALWSTVLRKPAITEEGRHGVAEHHDIDKLLNDLAYTDKDSSGWKRKFAKLKEKYLHHIKEEEQDLFVACQKALTAEDQRYMKQVFERRAKEEKAKARLKPEKKKDD